MPALPFRQTLAAGLLVVAPLILSVALPGALSAQTILTVSPQQCVWRAGQSAPWSAPGLDESAWKPDFDWKLNPREPYVWVRCQLDAETLRGLEHPALQVRLAAAYEVSLNDAVIGRNGSIESGGFTLAVLPDGRQRVLLGDVSGKGAAAAMAATLLLGAATARDSDSPAGLLSHLNRVLRENNLSGFATCLCADVAPDGAVTVANAGHLPPYREGREIVLDSGLPLGVASDVEYAEITLRLDPGATLTLISDGVVEARNKSGELFGFDRTLQISSQSAESIAHAALNFGQEDDITVLTLKLVSAASEGIRIGETAPFPAPS
ncbi:MAG: PP2C family protein-serine/threonine phosphatase [Terracidiphilus sp.]|jgi:hypothetical protein